MATVTELEKVVNKQNKDLSFLKKRMGELKDEITMVNTNLKNMQEKVQSDLKRFNSRMLNNNS